MAPPSTSRSKYGARSTGTGAKPDSTSSSCSAWTARQAPKYVPSSSSGKTRLTTTASVT